MGTFTTAPLFGNIKRSMEENQSFLQEFGDSSGSADILSTIDDVDDIERLLRLDDLSERVPNLSEDVTPKNSKLGDKLYRVFGYPSKVYYRDIARFIESYSQEGDVVLDPMCGSGSTALASLSTDRKAILNDGSALAHFVSKNIIYPAETHELQGAFRDLKSDIKSDIDALYEVECECCGEYRPANSVFQSDIYECSGCEGTFPLYENKTDQKSTYECPHCGTQLKTSVPDVKEQRVERRTPVVAKYKCRDCSCESGIRHELAVDGDILAHWESQLNEYEHLLDELWIPQDEIVTDRWYTRESSWPGFEKGARVVDLFTDRNRLALAMLNDAIEQVEDADIRSQLKFAFIASLIRSSNRMYETSVVKTYYQVPSVGKVQNVWTVFERKFKTLVKSRDQLHEITPLQSPENLKDWVRVLRQDASELSLPDNSVDYVFLDPPYGSQVGYYELNLFYSAWLRDSSEEFDEEVIIPMETDDDPEYARKWGQMMEPILREAKRCLKPGRYMTLLFHSKSDEIWNELRRLMFEELDFRYIGYLDSERGTTIHTNRLSDTNLKSAYITFQKREGESNIALNQDLSKEEKAVLREQLGDYAESNGEHSIRELRDEVIRIVHEEKLGHVPSEEEIETIVDSIRD
jgi:16S rRNA G966 N2-methylase RsmD/DNA-directed RNA polymerase subunit RPC12/RpoP